MHQTFFTILYLGCVGPGVGASVPPDEDGHRDLQAQGHHGQTQVGPDHLRYTRYKYDWGLETICFHI